MEISKEIAEKIISANGEEDDQKDEEKKMETFYALVRGFQEARKRRRDELNELETRKKKSGLPDSGWVPSFEWEDFTPEIGVRKQPHTPVVFSAGHCNVNKKEDKKEEYNERGLDLKLAL